MKKPKSKVKQIAQQKRATKRSKRLKESRKKVYAKRNEIIKKRILEKKKFSDFIKKIEESRIKG